MYVFADLEWVKNSKKRVSPTQLAAIKVDENWNILSSFFSRIKPHGSSFEIEGHMAFTGAPLESFRNADDANKVFADFEEWLDEDDVVCWWEWHSAQTFNQLFKAVLKRKLNHKTVNLKEYVEYSLAPSGIEYKGNPYSLANCRHINVPLIQHYAYNDVKTIVLLLKETGFNQSLLESAPLPVPIECCRNTTHYYYTLNMTTQILHRSTCPYAGDKTECFGVSNLRIAVKKQYKPCDCCKDEYEKEKKAYRQWKIEQSGCNYVYLKNSDVFHTKDCRFAIANDNVGLSNTYDNLIKQGKRPCKFCFPKPLIKATNYAKKQSTEIAMPKEQKNALLRFKKSKKTREQMLAAADSEAERENVYTLTNTSNVFFAGKGYSNFHLAGCKKLNGLTELKGFSKYSDAVRSGYTPCKHCKPTAKHDAVYSIPFYSKEVKGETIEDVKVICNENGFKYYEQGEIFRIETPVGIWNMYIWHKPVVLEHINLVVQPNNKFVFHRQPVMLMSFIDTIQYIKRHDTRLMRRVEENNYYNNYWSLKVR